MRYLLLIFGLFLGTSAFAQISTTFILPDTSADNNSRICLPITVINFTAGIEFGFALKTEKPEDGGALTFSGIQNLNPDIPGFTLGNFDLTTYVSAGLITVRWRSYTDECTTAPRITLDDGAILFEACYDVVGPIASQHPVEFFDKPDDDPFDGVDDSVPVIFNKRTQCNQGNDAFPGIDNGSVTIGVSPLILSVQDDNGIYQPGDTYCVDVLAESGFNALKGYQFGLQFDNTVIRPISATANTDLTQNSDGGYNLFGGDSFYGVWAPFGDIVETLPEGTALVTVCFEIIGDCSDRTDISVGEIPTNTGGTRPVDANGDGPGLGSIPVVTDNGIRLIVDNCNAAGFDVIVDCPAGPVNFNDTDVCVQIKAGDDFVEMTDIDYLINWDPAILEYVSIQNRNTALFISEANHFEFDQTANGILAFDWEAPGALRPSLNAGDVVFEVCFNAIGFGGTSPVVISNYLNDIVSASQGRFTAGLNPTNCAITIQKPDGVAVKFPDNIGFSSSQDNCFDLEVDGFTGVTDFDLYIVTSNALFRNVSFVPNVPGVASADLGGILHIFYDGPPILDLLDGESLGSVCYRAQDGATPSECSPIGLATIIPSQVITEESEGNSVPIESIDGEACVLFPNGFGLTITDAQGFIGDSLCVPVTVASFVDILTANVRFNFDPSLVELYDININGNNWPGLTLANFDQSQIGLGLITLNYDAGGTAVSSPNGAAETEVFEFCFRALNQEDCFTLSAENGAIPPTTTPDGDGSIIYTDGEVCLEDRLILLSINAVDASCSDNDDGMILFQTAARPNNEDIFIRTDNPIRFGNNGSVDGLLPGLTTYTIYNANGEVSLTGSIMIGVDPNSAAVADAGEDRELSCGENSTAVINGRNNVGETFEIFIIQTDGTTRSVFEGAVGSGGNIVAPVDQSGSYILEVISSAGCSDRDTVVVTGLNQPVAEAGETLTIDCNNNGITLTSAGSSTGNNVSYLWERINGAGDVLEEVGRTDEVPGIERGGRYRVTVTFTDLQCSNTDFVIVRDDRILPNSILPTQMPLECDGSPTVVSIGPEEDGIGYSWTRIGEALELGTSPSLTVTELGSYVVSLSNPANSCTRMDTIEVIASVGVPIITPPAGPISMPCDPDTLTLVPGYTNVDEFTNYVWSTADGRVVITDVDDANPRIVLPGTYQVRVENGACRDSFSIVVEESVFPQVNAGDDSEILCQQTFRLEGDASTTTGGAINYQWLTDGLEVPMGAAASVVVDQPGTYFLVATDATTGCSATDSVILSAPSGFPVYELADTIGGLGCSGDAIRIRVENPAEDYEYTWVDPSGDEISTTDFATAATSGFYTVTITNTSTNCQATDQVFVDDDAAELPFVAFRRNSLDISCESVPVIINAEPSVDGPEYLYTWSTVSEGEEPTEQGNDSLAVRTAGTYRLTILNQQTNCEAFRDIVVTDSRVYPTISELPGETLDCDTRQTIIGVNILDQPNNYNIQWAGPIGVDSLPQDTNRLVVTMGGTYNAVVINPESSCVTTATFRVEDLIDSIATLAIMAPDSFDCNNETVTIDASGTDLNSSGSEGISWTSLNGNTINPSTGSLIVSVDGAGDYVLAITDGTDCTVRDTVTVFAATDTPFSMAGEPLMINCGEMPQLDGTGSTPGPGPGVLYAWSASDGGEILSGEDTPRPFVAGPGTYELVVTTLSNGCANTSSTTVTLSEQASAEISTSFADCGTPVTVTGNLPAGTSGVWTAFNDEGSVFSTEENVATVTEIGNGLSLVWTLSAGMGCEDYSSDTLRVTEIEPIIANDDLLELCGNDNIGQIDVKINDQRSGPVTVRLLNEPTFGEIAINLNGDITFQAPIGINDLTSIDYEICSVDCPTLCDTATLRLSSQDCGVDPVVYNAITPNGDGMNETFEFEILNLRPNDFPDNELIIFNRWGDILYEAAPYNNNWNGTNDDGSLVPEGTYYYILRLDIGQGDIIRGDVTVVR